MQPFGFLLLLLISLIHGGECQLCHEDWLYYDEKCLGYGTTAVTWGSAQAICNAYGGRLAEPSSWAENRYTASIAREKDDDCVWLGASDIFHEGVWEWSSRQSPFSSYTYWKEGEPNNGGGADCLNLYKRYNYKWNDEICNTNCYFICAVPALER